MYLVEKNYAELAAKFDRAKYAGKKEGRISSTDSCSRTWQSREHRLTNLEKFVPDHAIPLDEAAIKWRRKGRSWSHIWRNLATTMRRSSIRFLGF